MDPFIAEVDATLCTGCQTCMTVCAYDAISRTRHGDRGGQRGALHRVRYLRGDLPSNAIQQLGFSDAQVLSEVRMLLQEAAAS